jgi:hypothetical protein
MTEPKHPPQSDHVVAPQPKRAAYRSPVLIVYGSASSLTRANSGLAVDQNAMNPGDKGNAS